MPKVVKTNSKMLHNYLTSDGRNMPLYLWDYLGPFKKKTVLKEQKMTSYECITLDYQPDTLSIFAAKSALI